MSDLNVNISSKLVEKIWDSFDRGISGGLKPWQIKRLAMAEAEANKIKTVGKAKTDLEVQPLEQDLKNQIARGEADHQEIRSLPYPEDGTSKEKANYYLTQMAAADLGQDLNYLKNIVLPAAEMTKDEDVSDKPIDDYWLKQHKNHAHDVSDKQMQTLWAKILSEEVKTPDSVSIRAMDMLASMSKSDLQLIGKLASLEFDNRVSEMAFSTNSLKTSYIGEKGLSYKEVNYLHQINILASSNANEESAARDTHEFTVDGQNFDGLAIGKYKFKYTLLKSVSRCTILFLGSNIIRHSGFHLGIPITEMGMQLIRIANIETNPDLIEELIKKITLFLFDQHIIVPDGLFIHRDMEKIIEYGVKTGIDFSRYRIDPPDDTPT